MSASYFPSYIKPTEKPLKDLASFPGSRASVGGAWERGYDMHLVLYYLIIGCKQHFNTLMELSSSVKLLIIHSMHFKQVPIHAVIFGKQCDVCSICHGTKTSLNQALYEFGWSFYLSLLEVTLVISVSSSEHSGVLHCFH